MQHLETIWMLLTRKQAPHNVQTHWNNCGGEIEGGKSYGLKLRFIKSENKEIIDETRKLSEEKPQTVINVDCATKAQ